jgi:hypothetical protein
MLKGGVIYCFLKNEQIFVINGNTSFKNCTAGEKLTDGNGDKYDGWGGGIYLDIDENFAFQQNSYFLFTDNITFEECDGLYGKNIFINYNFSLSNIINNITFHYEYDVDLNKLYDLMGYSNNNSDYAIPLLRYLIPNPCITATPEFTCPVDEVCCPVKEKCILSSEIQCSDLSTLRKDVCTKSQTEGSKDCIWIEEEDERPQCHEPKSDCEMIETEITCEIQKAAGETNTCIWISGATPNCQKVKNTCEEITNGEITCETQGAAGDNKCKWVNNNEGGDGICEEVQCSDLSNSGEEGCTKEGAAGDNKYTWVNGNKCIFDVCSSFSVDDCSEHELNGLAINF